MTLKRAVILGDPDWFSVIILNLTVILMILNRLWVWKIIDSSSERPFVRSGKLDLTRSNKINFFFAGEYGYRGYKSCFCSHGSSSNNKFPSLQSLFFSNYIIPSHYDQMLFFSVYFGHTWKCSYFKKVLNL